MCHLRKRKSDCDDNTDAVPIKSLCLIKCADSVSGCNCTQLPCHAVNGRESISENSPGESAVSFEAVYVACNEAPSREVLKKLNRHHIASGENKTDDCLCSTALEFYTPQDNSLPQSYLSCLPCEEETVPMVALECELPLSGRLSPPTNSSVAFQTMGCVSGDHDENGSGRSNLDVVGLEDVRGIKRPAYQQEDCADHEDDVYDDETINFNGHLTNCEDETVSRRRERKRMRSERSECKIEHCENMDVVVGCDHNKFVTQNDFSRNDRIHYQSEVSSGAASGSVIESGSPSCSSFETPRMAAADNMDDSTPSCSYEPYYRPPRISPFLNTPKQRKEDRRRILKLSISKMRAVEDPELFLRRSVLINNTMKRLQRELREEKLRTTPRRGGGGGGGCVGSYSLYRRTSSVSEGHGYMMQDDSFVISDHDRITDDMTDALVTRLEATTASSSTPLVPVSSAFSDPSAVPESRIDPPSSESPTISSSVVSSSSEASLTSSLIPCLNSDMFAVPAVSYSSVTSFSSSVTSTFCLSQSLSVDEGVFAVPGVSRESGAGAASCSSENQRVKQLYADMDSVFNTLIQALGDS